MFVLFALFLNDQNNEPLTPDEFRQLFHQWHKPLRNFIYFRCGDEQLAEDLTQDTFVKLWEIRQRVKKETVKPLLYKIAQNLTINHQKRKQLHYRFLRKADLKNEFDTPEKMMEMEQYEKKLQQALSLLPEGGREVFLMNRLEDLTYAEIADRLGLSVKAIEKRMTKSLKILREFLGTDL